MTSFFAIGPVVLSAVCVLALGLAVGFPLTRMFDGDLRARLQIAPAIGLGLFGVLAVPIFHVVAFSAAGIGIVALFAVAVAWMLSGRDVRPLFAATAPAGVIWVIAAFVLSLAPAVANAPHVVDGGIAFGDPVFDHAKVAIVDEIVRNGLPVHNPFYQQAGSADLLNYYYLWYFVSATAARVTGAIGWEVDVALTGVTAFLSLMTVGWAAVAYSGRPGARWWVLAIACAETLRFPLGLVAGGWLRTHLANEHDLEGWIEQASWVPQHMFAATLALLAILGVVKLLKDAAWSPRESVLVGVLIAAAYDSSIWIGGFGLAAILPILVLIGLSERPWAARRAIVANVTVTVASALAFAMVFLLRNLSVIGQRKAIALWTYPVLVGGTNLPNELAYWLFMLVLDFGFAYLLSAVWFLGLRKRWAATRDPIEAALAVSVVVPLLIAQFVVSVIANNDLGWRIVLIAWMAMAIVASSTASRLFASTARVWIVAAAVLVLVPAIASGGYTVLRFTRAVPVATPKASPERFAQSVELWQAVRAVTPRDQAVLNNPNDLADMTPWPIDVGWALLSDRRNCSAGFQWLLAYAPLLPPAALKVLDERIDRVFSGQGTNEDLRVLKQDHLCRTLVVVPTDGLWSTSLLDSSPYYTLVDRREGRWRIYR